MPSRGSPAVDSVSVSITVAPVVPAVAAEPSTDTSATRAYWLRLMSIP